MSAGTGRLRRLAREIERTTQRQLDHYAALESAIDPVTIALHQRAAQECERQLEQLDRQAERIR